MNSLHTQVWCLFLAAMNMYMYMYMYMSAVNMYCVSSSPWQILIFASTCKLYTDPVNRCFGQNTDIVILYFTYSMPSTYIHDTKYYKLWVFNGAYQMWMLSVYICQYSVYNLSPSWAINAQIYNWLTLCFVNL